MAPGRGRGGGAGGRGRTGRGGTSRGRGGGRGRGRGRGGRETSGYRRKFRPHDMPVASGGSADGMTRKMKLFIASTTVAADGGVSAHTPRSAEDLGETPGDGAQEGSAGARPKRVQEGKRADESYNAFRRRMKNETQEILLANAKASSKKHQKRKQYLKDKKERFKDKKRKKQAGADSSSDSGAESDEPEDEDEPNNDRQRARSARLPAKEAIVGITAQVERPPSFTALPKRRKV